MIRCRKSKVQEYQCQVFRKTPWKSEKEFIGFDACLAKELFYLWDKGIITTGCCCGKHCNDKERISYIGVLQKYVDKMIKLGYKVRDNNFNNNSFISKTKF